MGLDKKTPEAYKYILDKLKLPPSDLLFVDDSAENIAAATQAGLQTIQFVSENQTIQDLKNVLLDNLSS